MTDNPNRKLGTILTELDRAIADERAARSRRELLTKEAQAAKVAAAETASHPWLGKKVRRQVRRGWRAGKTATRTGTLTIFDPAKHRGLRELWWSGGDGAGELFVISASGQSGWRFDLGRDKYPGETDWELA